MTPERWREAKVLLESALDLPANERYEFLVRQCRDEALRREVQSLIASFEAAGDFAETPAAAILTTDEGRTEQKIAKTVGPYQIIAQIGSGGMGDVYLATDTRLGRKVALKALPPGLAANEERVRRLAQEARQSVH